MLVDVPKTNVESLETAILKHHPEAELESSELTIAPLI